MEETQRAIKSGKRPRWSAVAVDNSLPALGSARYISHHKMRYPDPEVLRSSVDDFMASFAAQEDARAKELARQRSEPDADGFVTVTRGGRSGPAREEEAKAKEEELKKREKNRVKDDFYRFQVRQKKKEQANELIKGFETDRRRVDEIKRRKGRIRPE